jgi:hypothetical protein
MLAALWRWCCSIGADFTIHRRATGQVVVTGKIPAGKMAAIREFCRRDLADLGGFTVRGSFGPKRTLRLSCSPGIGPGQRQRLRNFLVDLLR